MPRKKGDPLGCVDNVVAHDAPEVEKSAPKQPSAPSTPTKHSNGAGCDQALPPHPPALEDTVGQIYRMFKTAGGGADGGVAGLNGSVRAKCLVQGLAAMDIKGKHFIDFGAGDGRVLLSAMAAGAGSACGYELPENEGHGTLFHCVQERCLVEGRHKAVWEAQDIDKLESIPRLRGARGGYGAGDLPQVVYTFWVGMPHPTQERVLQLCAENGSVESLLVFQDRKWRSSECVIEVLHGMSTSKTNRQYVWLHEHTVKMSMVGSGENHTAWVLIRNKRQRNCFTPPKPKRSKKAPAIASPAKEVAAAASPGGGGAFSPKKAR